MEKQKYFIFLDHIEFLILLHLIFFQLEVWFFVPRINEDTWGTFFIRNYPSNNISTFI